MVDGTGIRPAGFVYVASHPERPGFTKIGYTLWHPRVACTKYPKGIKRLHRIENYLEAFGFGRLRDWSSDFHPRAQTIEQAVRAKIKHLKRNDVGRNKEVYNISHDEMVALVEEELNAQTH